jgi:hypothetical protein
MSDTGGEAPPGAAENGSEARLSEENLRLRAEVEALRASTAARKRTGRLRMRRIVAGILVVLTSVAILATTVGVWTQRTVSNTDRYVALVAPLADDPRVTGALAERLTEDVFLALDVEDRIQQALASIAELPESGRFLATAVAAGARDVIEGRVRAFLGSERFATFWSEVNRRVHPKVVALLRGDYDQLPNVEVSGGEVRLNLVSAVAEIVRNLVQRGVDALGIEATIPQIPPTMDASAGIQQLSSALGVALPEDFGQVTIMTADKLSGYQDTVRTLRRYLGVLLIVTLLLLVLTFVVAPDRRRIVIWLGVGTTVALLLGGVFLRRVRDNIIDQVTRPGAKAVAQNVFDQVGDSLRAAGLLVVAVAALAALAAYLLGRPPWIRRSAAWAGGVMASRPGGSEFEAWVAGHANPVRIGAIAVVVLVLFLTGIDWIPVVIVGALLGLLLWGVTLAERRAGEHVEAG